MKMQIRMRFFLAGVIAGLIQAPCALAEDAGWTTLKIFQGEFLGGANTGGDQRDKLEAQAHRHVRFAIPSPVRLSVSYSVDEHFIPKYWPKDIALTPDIGLSAIIKGPGKRMKRYLAATSTEFDAPGGSILTLHIDEDTFTSGYKTFYPAKWRVMVKYKGKNLARQTLPAMTDHSSGVQAAGPATLPAPVITEPPEGCGEEAECVKPPEPEPVDTPPVKPAAKTGGAAALDLAFWNAVKDTKNPVLLRAYLEKFPNGVFVIIARERLKGLKTAPAAQVAAPAAKPVPAQPPAQPAASGKGLSIREMLKRAEDAEDLDASLKWYLRAARKGSAKASAEAGQLVYQDSTDKKSVQKAFRLFSQAITGGYFKGCDNYLYALLNENMTDKAIGVFLTCYKANPEDAIASIGRWGSRFRSELQKKLKAAGRYNGAIDGVFGPASRMALDAYTASGAVKARPLVISRVGVGRITGKTPYTKKALQRALPGFIIREENYSSEGDIYSRLTVRRGGKLAMSFDGGDSVTQIAIHDPAITTRDGLRAGMTFTQLAKRGLTRGMTCRTGADDTANVIYCPSETFYLTFTFTNGEPKEFPPDDVVPLAKMPARARVRAILWFAGD